MKSDASIEIIPRHVALIMDGNGRWAKKRMLPRSMGHKEGVRTLMRIVKHAFARRVEYVTVYAFSTENKSRPKDEIDGLIDLIRKNFSTSFRELVENGIKVVVLGDRSFFPDDVVEIFSQIEQESSNGTNGTFCVALNYGARDEIVRAVNDIVVNGRKSVDEKTVSEFLYTKGIPDPDLIARTGGEKRLSNFLLYQAAYAELYFTDTLWPDFDEAEFDEMIADFATRNRRYGKV